MIAGELYRAGDPELVELRCKTRRITNRYNRSAPDNVTLRAALLHELFRDIGESVEIEPPFFCDYGWNIEVGNDVYFNFGCVILDCADVVIGDNVKLGPGVHLYAATHPTDPEMRRAGLEYAAPVRIGSGVWIGGATCVLPGVTIGENTTIGAGSVVTRDLPANVIAAGNPCRVLRSCDLALQHVIQRRP